MRGARSLRGFVVLGVVVATAIAGQGRPAFALDPPATTPTITAPTDLSVIGSDAVLTASSTAPTVQFLAGGFAIGSPAPVVAGVASTAFSTWGWPNATISLSAEDCNDAGCGAPSPSVQATINNVSPLITSPADGGTANTTPVLSATTDAPAVGFQLDGVVVDIDTAAPFDYTVTTPLTEGQHQLSVDTCGPGISGDTTCSGVYSTISFTVVALHPSITAIAPNPFSPNADGHNDSTTVTFSLPDTESVSWSIVNGLGTTVRGPSPLGQLSAGSHSFAWGGFNNARARVPDGTYTVALATTATVDGVDLSGSASAPVRVDTTAPGLGVPTGANSTFYPVRDGFRDTFSSKVYVNEPGTLWLDIRTTTGAPVRLLQLAHAQAGAFTVTWAGLNNSGHLPAAGTYHFRFIADDLAGNRRIGGTYNVIVSLRHLVTKTAVITKNGSGYDFVGSSASCAGGSAAQSAFKPNGLRLQNLCSTATDQIALAQYSFSVPGAISYGNIGIATYGFSPDAPVGVGSLIWNFPQDDADVVAGVAVTNRSPAWTGLGGIAASQHVSGSRVVEIAIGLVNVTSPAVYDIGLVRLTITYRVLS